MDSNIICGEHADGGFHEKNYSVSHTVPPTVQKVIDTPHCCIEQQPQNRIKINSESPLKANNCLIVVTAVCLNIKWVSCPDVGTSPEGDKSPATFGVCSRENDLWYTFERETAGRTFKVNFAVGLMYVGVQIYNPSVECSLFRGLAC